MEGLGIIHAADETRKTSNRLLSYVHPQFCYVCRNIARDARACHGLSSVGCCCDYIRDLPVHSRSHFHFNVVRRCRFDLFQVVGLNFEGHELLVASERASE